MYMLKHAHAQPKQKYLYVAIDAQVEEAGAKLQNSSMQVRFKGSKLSRQSKVHV